MIQPKRSRLFLAVSLNKPADYRFEEELFGELKRRARSSVTDLPWRPTFFPYLLSTGNAPEAVLSHALTLRQSSEVRDYREWLRKASGQWRQHGHLEPMTREVRRIATAIDRRIGAVPTIPKMEVKVDAVDVTAWAAGVPKPPVKVDFTPTLAALWGWCFTDLPGRPGYRKLLVRAIAADHLYVEIKNRLKSVWATEG